MNDMVIWSPGVTLEDIERQVIQLAYKHFQGNKTTTSRALGIAIRTLDTKLDKYVSEDIKYKETLEDVRRKRFEHLARQKGNYNQFNPNYTSKITGTLESSPASGVQPSPEASSQPPLPVSKRDKVQGVLLNETPTHSARKHRA